MFFTGTVNPLAHLGIWVGWQAAHIFPLERDSHWIKNGFVRWITPADSGNDSSRINSIQNGLLLSSTLHELFNDYAISVNPDVHSSVPGRDCISDVLLIDLQDGYKIISFIPDSFGVDGNTLDPICRDPANPNCVLDCLLRWHFRQSILANLRGAAEPSFEHDFPPGSDMLREICEGPFPAERFETELCLRLRGLEQARNPLQ